MTPEQEARQKITSMIEAAGWHYREEAIAGRRGGRGFSDYLLFGSDGVAVAVLEAKRAEVPPLSGKEQAREYADSIPVRHVFLSIYRNLSKGDCGLLQRCTWTCFAWGFTGDFISAGSPGRLLADAGRWVPKASSCASGRNCRGERAGSAVPGLLTCSGAAWPSGR